MVFDYRSITAELTSDRTLMHSTGTITLNIFEKKTLNFQTHMAFMISNYTGTVDLYYILCGIKYRKCKSSRKENSEDSHSLNSFAISTL